MKIRINIDSVTFPTNITEFSYHCEILKPNVVYYDYKAEGSLAEEDFYKDVNVKIYDDKLFIDFSISKSITEVCLSAFIKELTNFLNSQFSKKEPDENLVLNLANKISYFMKVALKGFASGAMSGLFTGMGLPSDIGFYSGKFLTQKEASSLSFCAKSSYQISKNTFDEKINKIIQKAKLFIDTLSNDELSNFSAQDLLNLDEQSQIQLVTTIKNSRQDDLFESNDYLKGLSYFLSQKISLQDFLSLPTVKQINLTNHLVVVLQLMRNSLSFAKLTKVDEDDFNILVSPFYNGRWCLTSEDEVLNDATTLAVKADILKWITNHVENPQALKI